MSAMSVCDVSANTFVFFNVCKGPCVMWEATNGEQVGTTRQTDLSVPLYRCRALLNTGILPNIANRYCQQILAKVGPTTRQTDLSM